MRFSTPFGAVSSHPTRRWRTSGSRPPSRELAETAVVSRLHERLADAASDGGVLACVGLARGVQPGCTVDPREVDGVARAPGKQLKILELRSAVALAKRVGHG